MTRFILSLLLLLPLGLHAQTQLSDGYINQLPPTVPVRAGYLTITNTGSVSDRLISASSPAFKMVEIHESMMHDGMMSMKEISEINIAGGDSVEFKPGGMHLMLMGMKDPVEVGDLVPVTLTFESGAQTIELEVRKP